MLPGGEIWSSAETDAGAMHAEEKLRGGDRKFQGCLMVDALHQDQADQIGGLLASRFPGSEVGVFRVLCEMGRSDI